MQREQVEQHSLLVAPATSYGWKRVQQVKRGDLIVIADQEVKVLTVKQDREIWWISFTDPTTGSKREQFYSSGDSVYSRI